MSTVHNFNAGPAVLPAEVIAQIKHDLPNYADTGISILESSHRTKEYESINQRAMERFRRILGLTDAYDIAFLQGGASMQFAMLPMNMLTNTNCGAYVISGVWAEKAYEEAERIGNAHIAGSTKDSAFRKLPEQTTLDIPANAAYTHICTNNTIYGTQWHTLPSVQSPLVLDMSSDIASRPLDTTGVGMIYAGAQKNIGAAGVTAVAIHRDFAASMHKNAPVILQYATHIKGLSLYNTPPVFSVYVLELVLAWIEKLGIDTIASQNTTKAQTIYDVIDGSGGFYRGHSDVTCRSQMNITFRLPDEALEKSFLQQASAAGMIGLAGHRSVGGLRASLYNASPLASAQALASLMREFMRTHG
ncbi:MAG: hypothetical protein RLY87_2350 [Chloroflexota bacterium]|jgi:phosphoserine aminotransferase